MTDIDENRLLSVVARDTERTMEQDLAFGIRQLVDIAERALRLRPTIQPPPAKAIDALQDLLRRLCTRRLPSGPSPTDAVSPSTPDAYGARRLQCATVEPTSLKLSLVST